jgi:hypothetical protein
MSMCGGWLASARVARIVFPWAAKVTRGPFVSPLTGSAGLWQPSKPGFAALASSTLGDAGSPADGTDNLIARVFNALSAAGPLLDAITATGIAAGAAQTAADAIKLPDLDAAIAVATKGTTAALGKLGAALNLLGASTTWGTGIGAAPQPPLIDISGATSGGSSGGSNVFSQATYVEGVSAGAVTTLSALAHAGTIAVATASEAALAVTVIGAAVALGLILVHYLGHGCGSPCTDAARAEQIYEAAADNLLAVYRAGMITLAQATAGMAHLFSAGTQHMATFGTSQAEKGALNMQKVISGEIASAQALAKPKPVPFDLTKARLDYISGPGWYPDSLQSAAALTDEYLLAFNPPKGA